MSTGPDSGRIERAGQDDVIGLDRLARSLLRVVVRTEPGSIIAVHGAPGGGKSEFFRRLAWLTHNVRSQKEQLTGVHPGVVWFDPWSWSKQGNLLSGLVAAVVRASSRPTLLMERAREVVSNVNRLRLDGQAPEGPGAAFTGADTDPVDALADGFATLVQAAKESRPGRLLIFVDRVDDLSPALRWQLFDGLRLVLGGGADATALVCVGREAAISAVRWHEGAISETSALRVLDDLLDLSVTVPTLDVRRIGTLMREYLGVAEATVRKSFGQDAIMTLSAAVAHRPLGSPRFLRRLALRVTLLAEYTADARINRDLSEAQWAWVIVSERWPRFRSFMVRGGRSRWEELRRWVRQPPNSGAAGATLQSTGELGAWMEDDLVLADYLRLHAPAFSEDAEGIFWLENILLAAGL